MVKHFPFDAVIGIIGVIVGWFLQFFTNKIGQVEVKRKSIRFDLINHQEIILITGYTINFTAHNTSGTSRVLRDICFSFYENKKEIKEEPLVEIQSNIDERSSINDVSIPANTIITCSDMQHNFMIQIPYQSTVYLKYKTNRNKERKIFLIGLLKKEDSVPGNAIMRWPPRD